MKYIFFIGFLFSVLNCNGQSTSDFITEIKVTNYEGLRNALNNEQNKLVVVNFWATWCVPCVEELPQFMEVNRKYKDNPNFKMILVSLDRAKNIDFVKKFIKKKSIITEVYLLDDNKNMNIWIPAVDSSWSGAIPATAFYKNGSKVFFKEEQLDKDELETIIKSNL